jgi:hypothetical protein
MSVRRNVGYFQFPLCLLGFSTSDDKERLQYIVSYCLCQHAQRLDRTFATHLQHTVLDEAARFLHVNIGSHDSTIQRWSTARGYILDWERRYGKDASVRIATRLFWEAHNNGGLTYREFSILCAINSVIGRRRSRPRRITERTIRVRAAGFKSWRVADLALAVEPYRKAKLLSPSQIRYTLERLHERKFFARARVGAKTVKYMLGVSDAALRALLLSTETYHSRFKAERAQRDRELMMAIRSANKTKLPLYPRAQK